MPSLIDLRRRIRAVKTTQQITKAMKMIAASRLRRSQERILNARPFAIQTLRVLTAWRPGRPVGAPAARDREEKAGGRACHRHHRRQGPVRQLQHEHHQGGGPFIVEPRPASGARPDRAAGPRLLPPPRVRGALRAGQPLPALKFDDAQAIAQDGDRRVHHRRGRRVYLVYNEFKSVMQQRIVVERLLPIPRAGVQRRRAGRGAAVDYIYEPNPPQLFAQLLPGYVEVQVWRALLESAAAENAARMTAMDAATQNATEMIEQLTLYMNKVRQAAITREIIEVVSGAQALSKARDQGSGRSRSAAASAVDVACRQRELPEPDRGLEGT